MASDDDAEPLLGRPATGDSGDSHPASLSHFFRSLQASLFPASEPTSPADSRRSSNTSSQALSDTSEGLGSPHVMAIWDAQEFIREFVNEDWPHHSASITIDCGLPLDELLAIGLLPEAEGFRACRRLVRVPVIHEEVSLALWQKLAETAGRSPAERAAEDENNNSSSNTNPADSPTDSPSQSPSRSRSALSLSSLALALKRKTSENGLLLWSAAQRLHKKHHHRRQPPQPSCAFCRCNCPANWAAAPLETAAIRPNKWRRKSSNGSNGSSSSSSSSSSSNNQDGNNNNKGQQLEQFWQRGDPRPPRRRRLCRCHTGDGGHYLSPSSPLEGGCEYAEHLQAGSAGVGSGGRMLGSLLWAGIASAGESMVSCVGVCCGAGVGAAFSVRL